MRPFKDIKEFKEKTGFSVGDVIITRVVQDWTKSSDNFALKERLITGFDHYTGKAYFGLDWYSVDDLFKTYEYLKDGKWLPFGVEETSTRPAKFKAGKEYFFCDKTGSKVHVFINAKYRDPIGHKIKVVANYTTRGEVHTDEKGNEIAKLYDGKIVNAKNEVKE